MVMKTTSPSLAGPNPERLPSGRIVQQIRQGAVICVA